jgi:hypothetical protein
VRADEGVRNLPRTKCEYRISSVLPDDVKAGI